MNVFLSHFAGYEALGVDYVHLFFECFGIEFGGIFRSFDNVPKNLKKVLLCPLVRNEEVVLVLHLLNFFLWQFREKLINVDR